MDNLWIIYRYSKDIKTGWWMLVVLEPTPLKKIYDFVKYEDDDIPEIWKIKVMFQTPNHQPDRFYICKEKNRVSKFPHKDRKLTGFCSFQCSSGFHVAKSSAMSSKFTRLGSMFHCSKISQ